MVVKEQLSRNDCVLNNSHGFYTRTIWVDKGCRAKFRVCYENIPSKYMSILHMLRLWILQQRHYTDYISSHVHKPS